MHSKTSAMSKLYMPLFLVGSILTIASCKQGPQGPDDRDNFVGTYAVTDQCSFDTTAYSIFIEKVGNQNDIEFLGDGLYNIGFIIGGIVTGTKLVIPIQQITISTTPNIYYEFTGQGALNGNELRVDYSVLTVQDGLVINQDSCLAIMLK